MINVSQLWNILNDLSERSTLSLRAQSTYLVKIPIQIQIQMGVLNHLPEPRPLNHLTGAPIRTKKARKKTYKTRRADL